MADELILRRQPLNFPHDDPDARWSVYCEGAAIGAIVLTTHRSDEPPSWNWTVHLHAGRFGNGLRQHAPLDGRSDAREDAMAAFRRSWDILRPAIGEEGWAHHLQHMAALAKRSGTKPPSSG